MKFYLHWIWIPHDFCLDLNGKLICLGIASVFLFLQTRTLKFCSNRAYDLGTPWYVKMLPGTEKNNSVSLRFAKVWNKESVEFEANNAQMILQYVHFMDAL